MKTTVELPDELARRAREHARTHGITLRALIERGLREQLRDDRDQPAYRWDPVTAGEPGDPFPDRPPHELAYDGSLAHGHLAHGHLAHGQLAHGQQP